MAYLKGPLYVLWFLLVSVIAFFYSLARWRYINVDRDMARLLGRGGLPLMGIRVRYLGLEHLEAHQPCIYVGNHQSGYDLSTFGRIYPSRTIVIGKKELIWIPFFGLAFYAAGNILLDRFNRAKAVASLGKVVERIRKDRVSVFVFPEGTRNRAGEGLLPFKKGAFHMAIDAQVPVVPMVCSPLKPLINWKERRIRPGELEIRILPPVPTTGLKPHDADKLCGMIRDQMSEALRGLSTHEGRPSLSTPAKA